MEISAKTEYAVRAMLQLAEAADDDGRPVPAEALAHAQDLPRKFLETILADLRRAGLVRSVQGARGGVVVGQGRPCCGARQGRRIQSGAGDGGEASGELRCVRVAQGGGAALSEQWRPLGQSGSAVPKTGIESALPQ